MAQDFSIARWNESDEEWTILERFATYDDADERIDFWCNKYPAAWVEILDPTCC